MVLSKCEHTHVANFEGKIINLCENREPYTGHGLWRWEVACSPAIKEEEKS